MLAILRTLRLTCIQMANGLVALVVAVVGARMASDLPAQSRQSS